MMVIVNGERIPEEAIREEARAIRPRLQEAMEGEDPHAIEQRVKEWSRENVIERVLLRQAAWADPEPVPPAEIDAMLERARSETPGQSGCIILAPDDAARRGLEEQIRMERLLAKASQRVKPPAFKEVAEHYRKHRDGFFTEEAIHARHIVKNVDDNRAEDAARQEIEAVAARLAAGESFEAVADEVSDCPGRGGDLGWFARGQMVEEFDAVVFGLEPGAVSPVFRTPFGFHIAKLEQRHPAGVPPLEEVRERIEQLLLAQRQQESAEAYLDGLWKQARIEDEP
jgi:hypothetical protein